MSKKILKQFDIKIQSLSNNKHEFIFNFDQSLFDSFSKLEDNLENSVNKSIKNFINNTYGINLDQDPNESSQKEEKYSYEGYSSENSDYIKKKKKKKEKNDFENKYFDDENNMKPKLEIIKHVKFNLPGQPYTIFKKSEGQFVMNNFYFAEFFDRFLFYLNEQKIFDSNYKMIIVGMGNGGQIALTFASLYE